MVARLMLFIQNNIWKDSSNHAATNLLLHCIQIMLIKIKTVFNLSESELEFVDILNYDINNVCYY